MPDDEAQEATVQMLLTPMDHHVGTAAGYAWQVFSTYPPAPFPLRKGGKDTPLLTGEGLGERSVWTLHASGNIVPSPVSKASPSADLASAQARCQTRLDVASRYQQSREEGIDYGPAFQGVEQLFHGDGEALGHIRLSEDLAAEVGDYRLHPALLDACLQVGGSLYPNEPGQVYLPTGVERLALSDFGNLTSLWCHAKAASQTNQGARRIDFDMFDERGARVAQLSGLSLWSVNRRALLGSGARADWLYRVDWRPAKRAEQSLFAKERGNWLILADRKGVGAELAARLEKQGEHCVVVPNVIARSAVGDEAIPKLVGDCFASLAMTGAVWRGVVYLWSLDANGALAQQDVPDTVRELYAQALHLTQAILQSGTRPRLWLVTQGAAADGTEPLQLAQAPLWGLGRTIVWEHPSCNARV